MFDLDSVHNSLTEEFPLGPIDTARISDELFKYFFIANNTPFQERLKSNPEIIIGRRGSGKTTFLKATKISDYYNKFIEIHQHIFLDSLINKIEDLRKIKKFILAEDIAFLCDELLFSYLFTKLEEENLLNESLYASISNYLNFSPKFHNNIPSCHDGEERRQSLYKEAREISLKLLEDKNIRIVLLLDNIENYTKIFAVNDLVEGLLQAMGGFNQDKRFHIRFCIPGEVARIFEERSTNHVKDFQNTAYLSWNSKEILNMISWRLNLAISKFAPEIYKEKKLIKDPKIYIQDFFPDKIKNLMGIEESPVPYIMRHTQLLPRHALLYFNKIINLACKRGILSRGELIPEDIICNAIKDHESGFVREIIAGFRMPFPEFNEFLKYIVKLPPKFKYKDLEKIFQQQKRLILINGNDDISYFLDMVLDTGCIGIVEKRENQFIRAIFRYASPGKMIYPEHREELCLHPIFTQTEPPEENKYAIYPTGTSITN